jgi:hypothetical protein
VKAVSQAQCGPVLGIAADRWLTGFDGIAKRTPAFMGESGAMGIRKRRQASRWGLLQLRQQKAPAPRGRAKPHLPV